MISKDDLKKIKDIEEKHRPFDKWLYTGPVVWIPEQVDESEWEQVKVADTGCEDDAAAIAMAHNDMAWLISKIKELSENVDL